MDFIITYDPRSGSTYLSKLITTKFNSAVLPETNFIFFILKYSQNKKELIKKILKEKKFKSLRIKRNKLKTIIDKNYPNKKKIINVISKTAAFNIYKQKKLVIGLKKNQIEKTKDLLSLFEKLKLIHLVRDPRNIYLSKIKATKINKKFSKSIIINIYIWVKILNEIKRIQEEYGKRIKILKYENILTDTLFFEKDIKKFLKLRNNYSKKYFLPKDQKKIHLNLYKKDFKQITNNYNDKLNFLDKFFFKFMCYNLLLRYGYETKKNYFYQSTSKIFSILVDTFIKIKALK